MSTGQVQLQIQLLGGAAGQQLAALTAQMNQLAAAQRSLLGGAGGGHPPPGAPPAGGGGGLNAGQLQAAIGALVTSIQQGGQALTTAIQAAAASIARGGGAPPPGGGPSPPRPPPVPPPPGGGPRPPPPPGSPGANANAQNLQAQAFDVFTQLGSGASPMLVIIQQGPQVIQALGGFRGALDAVKAALGGMGTSILRASMLLGGLGLALAALAVVMAADARAAESEMRRRESQHQIAKSLIAVERQLQDARNNLATATHKQSDAEGAATRIRILAGRSVLDYVEAQREHRKELLALTDGTDKWIRLQRGAVVAITAVTLGLRAMRGDVTAFADGAFEATLKSVSGLFDMLTGNEQAVADARAELKRMEEAKLRHVALTKEFRDVSIELDEAMRNNKGIKERTAALKKLGEAAYEAVVAQQAAILDLARAEGEINNAQASALEGTPSEARLKALQTYMRENQKLFHQVNEANESLDDHWRAFNNLAMAYELAINEADMFGGAVAKNTRFLAEAEGAMDVFSRPMKEIQQQALDTATAVDLLTRSFQEGQTSPEAYAAGLERISEEQRRAAKARAVDTANTVIGAISDPLGAIASAGGPIAAGIIAGIQAAADLPGTLNSLTQLFSNAAEGLTIGGGAVARFIADLVSSIVPAMVEAADDFVLGLVDGIPDIIEGLAAAIPRLAVAFVELFSPLFAARVAVALATALFSPETWIEAGKALGQGFLDALAALWETLRDLVEKLVPGKQFGGARTGFFSGGGAADTAEYYSAGAIFGRGDQTGLFQSDGWLGRMFGRRRESRQTNNYNGGVILMGGDAVRSWNGALAAYGQTYGGP